MALKIYINGNLQKFTSVQDLNELAFGPEYKRFCGYYANTNKGYCRKALILGSRFEDMHIKIVNDMNQSIFEGDSTAYVNWGFYKGCVTAKLSNGVVIIKPSLIELAHAIHIGKYDQPKFICGCCIMSTRIGMEVLRFGHAPVVMDTLEFVMTVRSFYAKDTTFY